MLYDAASREFVIARDPAPLLPVYRLLVGANVLFSSDPAMFSCGGAPLRVSWANLGAHLLRPELRTAQTCLEGVEEVAPGWLRPLDAAAPFGKRLWDPWEFAAAPWRLSRQEAVEALRATAVQCVSAWASDARRVAVAASGGVDSSFVCAALAAGEVLFDCATVATADSSGDESAYVRKLASALHVRAVARTYDPEGVDLSRPASAGLPRPVRKTFQRPFRRAIAEACGELGADCVFDGNGGDNLFAYIHSSSPALDRLWSHGPGLGFARTVLDLSRLTDIGLPAMLRMISARVFRPPAHTWKSDARLLSPSSVAEHEVAPLTDWLNHPHARLPGKRAHLKLVMRSQNFLNDLAGRDVPFAFSPLLSQPLLEFCLSVPTWKWCSGGINRSLAREAFAAELPASVTARVSKAGPDSFVRAIFARNRRGVRELVLGGLLRDHGLIDADAVEAACRADEYGEDPTVYRLLDLAEAEAWARSWS
ncbi:MAG: asparagine synthase-related protein [Novosphingobium sp.]|nr:asparagine synthase-related protein [Novosphingobium sp.]